MRAVGKPLYDKMGFVEFGEILRAKEDPDVEVRRSPLSLSQTLASLSLTLLPHSFGL